jgi:hypothetical protein
MPKLTEAIPDANRTIAALVRTALVKTTAGEDKTEYFAAGAGYQHKPDDAAEMKAELPRNWENDPIVLVRRTEADGLVTSSYRLGGVGDTRLVTVSTDASGKFHAFRVQADPDNR